MTDKQIIIDGVDVRKCKHFEAWYESRPNGFGGITIENYCYLYEDNCEKYPQCLYRSNQLQQVEIQLKRKEQECNKLYIQLKADEEYHKEEENTLRKIIKKKEERNIELYKENNKLKQTLTEIKEIAECCQTPANCKDYCQFYDECIDGGLPLILQKISECEVNNE